MIICGRCSEEFKTSQDYSFHLQVGVCTRELAKLRAIAAQARAWQKEAIPIARECNYIAAIDLVEQIANADLEGE